jgi:hypothetical protein
MRRLAHVVKQLASAARFCHFSRMAKDTNDKERIKAERLRAALRANLRRRKAKPDAALAATPTTDGREQ